jgi:hypothetical protein
VPGKQVELTLHEALVGAHRPADLRGRQDGSGGTEHFPHAQRLVVTEQLEHTVIFEVQWVIA